MTSVVVIGGTGGLGREVAGHYLAQGREVVLSGRDPARASSIATELNAATGSSGSADPPPLDRGPRSATPAGGGSADREPPLDRGLRSATPAGGGKARGIGLDLTRPEQIGPALAEVGPVGRLVLSGIDRGTNSVDAFDHRQAVALATQKLAGYVEVVYALRERLAADGAIVIFGGQARVRPYPGSTMVSTVNGGVCGMVRTLSVELAPIRVNAIHPGIVGDSPFWAGKPAQVLETFQSGTLTGQLATMADVVGAVVFLLENASVNGVDLVVDGGWR